MNCCIVVLCMCVQLILFFCHYQPLAHYSRFLHSHKQTVKWRHANTGPNLRTETVSWANHPQCSTRPSSLYPLTFFFSLSDQSVYVWESVCLNSRVWLPADGFGQGSGPVFSLLSLINHLSLQSLCVFVCVFVSWFWFAFVYTHHYKLYRYLTVLPHHFNLYLNRQIFTTLHLPPVSTVLVILSEIKCAFIISLKCV